MNRAQLSTGLAAFGTILVPVRGAADFRVRVCAEIESWSAVGE
jgi:hypothetical protein